jgi:predicted DNA-binding ribbon-helix-helix protein
MHAVTVRLQDTVYSSVRQLAEREGLSLEQLIEETLAERASRPSDTTLRQAYEILAEDADAAEVEELMAAQAETLLGE